MHQKRLLLTTLTAIVCAMAVISLYYWFFPLVTDKQGMRFNVNSGATLHSVALNLKQQNLIHSPFLFMMMARLHGTSTELKAGEYLFPQWSTMSSVLHQLSTGSGIIFHVFTIIPGTSFSQVLANLQKEPELKHTITSGTSNDVMKQIGHPEVQAEGEFFPDTYYFAAGTPDTLILKRAFNAMQIKLNQAWQTRDLSVPFASPYQALIAASIIEKEAYLPTELPVIAGVMVNRLRKDMLLQFDPTVIYGLQNRYTGVISKSNLVENTPYNTYVHKGLPPTPISMPSLAALQAIMHPQQHDYLYFVAQGDGSHHFSRTLDEHNLAVKQQKR